MRLKAAKIAEIVNGIVEGNPDQIISTVSKIEDGKVYVDIVGAVSGIGEGAVKGSLVIDIETGIQDTANIEMDIKAGGNDMKISTKTTTTKI